MSSLDAQISDSKKHMLLAHTLCSLQEAAFVNSMSSMMAPMPAPLTGNPDRDFALEMSQHHQVTTLVSLFADIQLSGIPQHVLEHVAESSRYYHC